MGLVIVVMGQNCSKFLPMCLESVKDADHIVYIDGGSSDNSKEIARKYGEVIYNKFDKLSKKANGQQRNIYLNYVKEQYPGEWCLCLDADEVLEDYGIQKIKAIIQNQMQPKILSPRIHHFVGDLGHEDNTREAHFVPNRLFKITDDLKYEEVEHPVLQGEAVKELIDIHIWHLRECLGVFATNKKFKSNLEKSNMHTEVQLRQWNRDMLFGNYPRKRVHYDSLPSAIRREFGI